MEMITKLCQTSFWNPSFKCLPVWTSLSLLCQHFESDLEAAKKTECHRLRIPADSTDGQDVCQNLEQSPLMKEKST